MPPGSPSTHCRGPLPRRDFLQAGTLALSGSLLGSLTLSDILARRAQARESAADTAVILVYLAGGPSQLETYDLKTQAPTEYRSVFKAIPTVVPGMDICELFPRQAAIADKFSLVRSLNHDVGIHSDGGIVIFTGKRPTVLDPLSQSKSEHPDFGSVTSKLRSGGGSTIPRYIGIPSGPYMTRPTYLGSQHAAFATPDPANARMALPQPTRARDGQALIDRQSLLQQFDRLRGDLDQHGVMSATDEFRAQALQMLASPQAADAFDLSKESDALRERYGKHLWGNACLLARRLAEAGAGVITVNFNTPKNGPDFTNWDDHILNAMRPGHFAGYMRTRLPYMDESLSALIEDIYARGLDQRIMVVVVGEFGRTPRLSHNASGTGRDHWPQAYTALVSGGGLKMGQVVGATNSKSEYPTEKPCTPQDLLATIYRHLRIDYHAEFVDFSGRPTPILGSGEPIADLI